MSKFEAHLDESAAINANSITSSTEPWKERIVNFLIQREDPLATYEEILQATDPKYNETNYESRKHSLDSQFTYIRKDLNIVTKRVDDRIAVLGVIKEDKVIPFKNAIELL